MDIASINPFKNFLNRKPQLSEVSFANLMEEAQEKLRPENASFQALYILHTKVIGFSNQRHTNITPEERGELVRLQMQIEYALNRPERLM